MTNWTTMALMAAALILAMQGHPRAQSTDGETSAKESVCSGLDTAALDLCNAYCVAMDCEGEPKASEWACSKVRANFQGVSGGLPPCVIDCPCGDPADLVPITMWPTDVADCTADPTRVALFGFSFEGGTVSISTTTYGRDCQYVVDDIGQNVQEQPISRPQVDACSGLIVNYAQALKDAGQVAVGDFGCSLR